MRQREAARMKTGNRDRKETVAQEQMDVTE